MRRFADRVEAGRLLAKLLGDYRNVDALVLGIPRGGVVVAAEVAAALGGELDVAVARKLGAPLNPELAIGAVAADGTTITDQDLVARLGVSPEMLKTEVEKQTAELRRRLDLYRSGRPEPKFADRVVILVDDGVATGATMEAVLRYLRRFRPARLLAAVPVGPPPTLERLGRAADELVCPLRPTYFLAVGEFYDDFGQVGDDEVVALLSR